MAAEAKAFAGGGCLMIRNLDYIRALPQFGERLYESLADLERQQNVIAQQTNANPIGEPLPPPAIDSLTVTGQNGHFHAQIQHAAEFYRGAEYHLEYADNPSFQSPRPVALGPSREWHDFLGNGTYYFRAFAAYPGSAAGPAAYHGGRARPMPVSGGGSIGGPEFLPPQGSGTGQPGEGLSGPGPIPFRSSTGAPPIRGESTVGGGSAEGSLLPGPQTGIPSSSGIGGGASGGGDASTLIVFDRRTLIAGANAIPSPASGLLWLLFLINPAGVTATISFAADVQFASPNIDTNPGADTASPFILARDTVNSKWVQIVQGATGMTA